MASLAARDFAKTRSHNPTDDHGYITHVQLILRIAEALKRAANVQYLDGLEGRLDDQQKEWLHENIVLAEDLLGQVRHARAAALPGDYESACLGRLSQLYGSFDAIISTWEDMLSRPGDKQAVRRALASAYLARRERKWADLPTSELNRIANLMDQNLSHDPTNPRDIRAWFQAYRRLPEFSFLEAFTRLDTWAGSGNSLDAHYYLYILHFLSWFSGDEQDDALVREELRRTHDLAAGRRSFSYEWLGSSAHECPLVHFDELGDWDDATNFWSNTAQLQRVTGSIQYVRGMQAGTIRVGHDLHAFFVPGTRFWRANTNDIVNFLLGFSYDGLRAWSVEPGAEGAVPRSGSLPSPAVDLTRLRGTPRTSEEAQLDLPTSPSGDFARKLAAALAQPAQPSPLTTRQAVPEDDSLRNAVIQYIVGLVEDGNRTGRNIDVATIGSRLAQQFPGGHVYQKLGFPSLSEFLSTIPELAVQSSKHLVRIRPTTGRSNG